MAYLKQVMTFTPQTLQATLLLAFILSVASLLLVSFAPFSLTPQDFV